MNKHVRNIFIASLISASIIGSVALATPAAAQSVGDIQRQIQELLAKVAELRAQLALQTQASPVATTAISNGMPHRVCAIINRNLSHGATGDDVTALQDFLREGGYFYANTTGYFGSVTAQAVAKWQASQGISALGMFGPMSRERLKVWCGGWNNQERFSATPQRGSAPLDVSFNTWLSGFRVPNISYTIDFGDGTSERAADCPAPADACTGPGVNTHVYQKDGTYTATLNKITDPCAGQPACRAAIQSEIVAKVQVYVGSIGCTKEYRPVCASKPIVCITTPCNPIQQTYSNRCMAEADGATYLYDGQCRNTNQSPTISSFSGPTALSVNQSGTWTIQASDPDNQSLSYSVIWGDEVYPTTGASAAPARDSFVQNTTFTHSYARAGIYTVIIVVRDSQGLEAKTSTIVRVEGGANTVCTLEYAPVCGRPTGCANTCAPGMICPAICQLPDPVTYSNRCQLNASGAQYLHDGVCHAQSGNSY